MPCSTLFFCTFLRSCFARLQRETYRNFLVTRFMEEMSYVFLFTFRRHKIFMLFFKQKNASFVFISRSRSLSPFFALSFAGLPPRALSIQQKFRFEISEIPRAQWNGTFRLHRPDPSHRALGYCSCKQDTKEWYWGQQFCQMERDISVRPTEMTRPVKVDHLQSWVLTI